MLVQLSIQGGANVYTKAESDVRYHDKSQVFTQTETDDRYYHKTASDTRYALVTALDNHHQKGEVYTQAESDAKYALLTQFNTLNSQVNGATGLESRMIIRPQPAGAAPLSTGPCRT